VSTVALVEPIRIAGLAEFNRNLRKLSADLPKSLRMAHNEGANLIADTARPKVASRSGRAAKTVKAKSTRTESRVSGGSVRAAYYAWLDFGGRVGVRKSVHRQFYSSGRYLYPSLAEKHDDLAVLLEHSLLAVAREAGVEVD
jgi:hypothetical protein